MQFIEELKARYRDWKFRRDMRIVHFQIDGQGADALLIALTASGRIYSTHARKPDNWSQMETPLEELEEIMRLRAQMALASPQEGGQS